MVMHIIKKTDERDARGQIKVAHIMISAKRENTDQAELAKKKVFEIHKLILEGADFAKTARQYSNDTRSAANGGVLQMFGSGDMVPEC